MVALTPFRRTLFGCSVNAFNLVRGYSKGGTVAKGTGAAGLTKDSLPSEIFDAKSFSLAKRHGANALTLVTLVKTLARKCRSAFLPGSPLTMVSPPSSDSVTDTTAALTKASTNTASALVDFGEPSGYGF